MRSSTKVAVTAADWQTNRAGRAHHHQYGAGLVNAGAAMLLATQWLNLEPMQILTLSATGRCQPAGLRSRFHFSPPCSTALSGGLEEWLDKSDWTR